MHHQKQIRRLSLITDGTCPHAGQHLEGLSCLAALNELEWEGIQNPSEASALRGCLQHIRRIKGATALISGTSSIHDHSPIPAKCLPNAMRDSNDRGQPMKRERESWAGPVSRRMSASNRLLVAHCSQRPRSEAFRLLSA